MTSKMIIDDKTQANLQKSPADNSIYLRFGINYIYEFVESSKYAID